MSSDRKIVFHRCEEVKKAALAGCLLTATGCFLLKSSCRWPSRAPCSRHQDSQRRGSGETRACVVYRDVVRSGHAGTTANGKTSAAEGYNISADRRSYCIARSCAGIVYGQAVCLYMMPSLLMSRIVRRPSARSLSDSAILQLTLYDVNSFVIVVAVVALLRRRVRLPYYCRK
jgi:hypothetical protein